MQEDIDHRAVTLAINATKITARVLKSAITKYLAHRKHKLRYVFDIADTGKRENSVEFQPWALTEENAQAAALALERGYDVPAADGLERQIHAASTQLARNYWFDHQQEIIGIVDGSFLEGYDIAKAAIISISWWLMKKPPP